jgi:NAD(P)-dependent dehydrogenase (short-subunit alcohol dehydrogenase family)
MEVNLLGPALLTELLLPALQGGRVVNVAAAVYGLDISDYTVDQLLNKTKVADDIDFQLSKLLLIHHAKELALR